MEKRCSHCGLVSLDEQRFNDFWTKEVKISVSVGNKAGFVSENVVLCPKCMSEFLMKSANFIEEFINDKLSIKSG